MITSTSRKILPHELQHLFTLLNACKSRRHLLPKRIDLLLIKIVVSVHVARPHQQNVAKSNLSPLRFSHSLQIGKRDGRSGKSVVRAVLRQAPFVMVQKHSPADNPLLAPSAYAIHVTALFAVGSVDVVEGDAVVEDFLLLVAEMAEAVPLRRRLGVESPDVIIHYARRFLIQFLVEGLTAEERLGALGIERPVETDAGACLDLFGGGCYDFVSEAVKSSELVLCPVETPGIVVRAILVQWEVGELGDAHGGDGDGEEYSGYPVLVMCKSERNRMMQYKVIVYALPAASSRMRSKLRSYRAPSAHASL
jgi:hypothetical protein